MKFKSVNIRNSFNLIVILMSLVECIDYTDLLRDSGSAQLQTTTPPTATNENSLITNRAQTQKLKYHDVWYEINESTVLNCSLRVNKDQHVVWHRKYDKMGVHVLTIGSETFISDLRIRPIKQQFNKNNQITSLSASFDLGYSSPVEDVKVTWNLEIRRLKKEDTALYYCVLNSENSYGQIYKLNVLSRLRMLNRTEITINTTRPNTLKSKTITLVCKYEDLLPNPNDQIKWFFNKNRIKSQQEANKNIKVLNYNGKSSTNTNNAGGVNTNDHNHYYFVNSHFSIAQTYSYEKNETYSTLTISNFNYKYHFGKYKCQYRGLVRSVKIYPLMKNDTSSKILYKQSVYSFSASAPASSGVSTFATSYQLSTYSFSLLVLLNSFVFISKK